MRSKKEELKEIYKKMPIEEFVLLQNKKLDDYTPDAKKAIIAVSEERKNELLEFISERKKESIQKITKIKAILSDIESKLSLIPMNKRKNELEKRYKVLSSSFNNFVKLIDYINQEPDIEYVMKNFFGDLRISIPEEVEKKLEKFNSTLDKEIKKIKN